MSAPGQREFFTVRTVSEALTGFRPARRTAAEIGRARRRARPRARRAASAPHALPGFARATVDGFAVRAADTYGASEGLPSYLDLAGEVRMGEPPEARGAARQRGGDRHGRAAAAGRRRGPEDRAHPGRRPPSCSRSCAPRRPAREWSAPTRTPPPAPSSRRAGRPLRAQDLGHARRRRTHRGPRSRAPARDHRLDGRRAGAPGTPDLRPARSATPRPPRWPRWSARPAASPTSPASCPTTARRWPHPPRRPQALDPFKGSLEGLLPESDVLVVSAGSSVGARDETAAAIASLGEPGIWCHGLALRPGKPTLLADVGGVP